MAMKKAEMEEAQQTYHALMAMARAAHREGLYRQAVECALSCWDHIDGMMQYERRYEDKEFVSIDAIDMVVRYAPLILDFNTLDKCDSLLQDQRRIEKNTSDNLRDRLAKSRSLMWEAHRLWSHLEEHPDSSQDELRRTLGGDQNQWRTIVEAWEKMGLLRRKHDGGSYRLTLTTRMGEVTRAKCPACGKVADAPKAMFLEEMPCPACGTAVLFVLLPKDTSHGTED